MKKYIVFLFAALLSAISCNDTRYDYLVNDTVYFAKDAWQEHAVTVMSEADFVYDVWVHKAGYFQKEFRGSLAIDYNYLVAYNAGNGTDYPMLDEAYYSFDRNFTIEAGINELAVPLTVRTNKLVTDLGYGTYYIPLAVTSTTPDEKVNEAKANFILAFTLQQPVLGIDGENKGEVFCDLSASTAETYDVDITAVLDVEAPEELAVVYAEAPDLAADGENVLPGRYYSYEAEVAMPAGERYAENFLTLHVAEMPRGRWIVPIRITTANNKVKVAENAYLKLVVVKGTLDDIQWAGDYLQVNEIIVPASTLNESLIATAAGVDVEASADENWLQVAVKDGNVYMAVTEANNSTNKERVAMVTLLDKSTLLEKTIPVRQCMQGYGTLLNKKLWSIPAYSQNVSGKSDQFGELYNGVWATANRNSYIEFNNRADGTEPFVLTFDLGEQHGRYNSFGLMPRLQWTQPAPKRVKIEVSDDRQVWTVLGPDAGGTGVWNAFTEAELKGATNSFNDHYEGMVHWFDLGVQNKRYIRLSMYEGWYQDTGKVICLSEVFVSNR